MVDVLRGADTAKVRQFGHDTLSTYGIGGDLDAGQWRSVFRQLVAGRLLDADVQGHGALRLTAASEDVLKGRRSLSLRLEPPARERKRARTKRRGDAPVADLAGDALLRFDALREWRAGTAREQNVPAYVIFHDATLRAIAIADPAGLSALRDINGVGDRKLERYGSELLAALSEGTS